MGFQGPGNITGSAGERHELARFESLVSIQHAENTIPMQQGKVMPDDITLVRSSLEEVKKWIEEHDYKGYEPFDGLSSPLRALTFKNLLLERILTQLVRQSPVNLRPLLGITQKESTKGRGYMAHGYLILYKATGHSAYKEKAIACLDWLDRNKAPKYTQHSWSNHFDFAGRGGGYTKDDPIIVWTSLIGQAFIEAYEVLGEKRYLDIAESVCGWILDLPREKTFSGDSLSYLAYAQESIHNSNMLGGAMLAKTYQHTGNREYLEVARSAMEYSCSRQLPDGSWWYGERSDCHWIDNFHTGYNLDSLRHYINCTSDETYQPHLDRGLRFYMNHFFENSGRPKYYHKRVFPVDIQCAAQAIDTLSLFGQDSPDCLQLAWRVARWTIENMQENDGHFQYRHYPWGKARTAMLHWGQATMFKALSLLWANSQAQ